VVTGQGAAALDPLSVVGALARVVCTEPHFVVPASGARSLLVERLPLKEDEDRSLDRLVVGVQQERDGFGVPLLHEQNLIYLELRFTSLSFESQQRGDQECKLSRREIRSFHGRKSVDLSRRRS